MLAIPVISNEQVGGILSNVTDIFHGFGALIALAIGLPLLFWIIQMIIQWAMDAHAVARERKEIAAYLEIAKRAGYEVIAPPTEEEIQLKEAVSALKKYGITVKKK
jgi:hypothetical protein